VDEKSGRAVALQHSPLGTEAVKKLGGRASWPAIAPASPCPMRLGRSPALPVSAGENRAVVTLRGENPRLAKNAHRGYRDPIFKRTLRVPISLLFLLLVTAAVDFVFPANRNLSSSFESRVSRLINQTKFEAGFWGIQIVSLKDNYILYSLNANKNFLPASNMKLIIGAAALDRLGPDYRFETCVYAQGRIDSEGRLQGDLVLVGVGDPNLDGRTYTMEDQHLSRSSSPLFIERLADQIAGRPIKDVEGDIVADDTAFLHEPYGPGWEHDDLPWGYGAPASALAVNENVFEVEVVPADAVGDPGLVSIAPFFEGLTLINRVETVEKGRQLSIGMERSLEKNRLILQGEVSKGSTKVDYTLAVEDPAEFAALLLKAALEKRGILVSGKALARHLRPLDALEKGKPTLARAKTLQPQYLQEQKVASNPSIALIETLRIMMKVSHNLYAEILLRKLGAESAGVGSLESGVVAVKTFLEKTGTAKEDLHLSDGSGMSRTDLITPESIIRLLQYMQKHPQGQLFLDTLPVGGTDGTLEHRMQKTPATGRIHAKTGTSKFVTSLSGYAQSKSGEMLAFSIMANNHRASNQELRQVIDQICTLMAEYAPRKKASHRN